MGHNHTAIEMPQFNPIDPNTWPLMLTIVQVAAIYQRSPEAIRTAYKRGRFHPSPVPKMKPLRWRKSDVLRHVEGALSAWGVRHKPSATGPIEIRRRRDAW